MGPDEFIPIAERTGLIVPLGRALLRTALSSMAAAGWPQDTNMHVNMSRRELQQPNLVRDVERLLVEHAVDPQRLVIEITETAAEVDSERMVATLNGLSNLGVRLALDDFGAGVTALSNLWSFPLDIVKLDRSLISSLDPCGGSGDTRAQIQSLIDLCHAHGLVVTAEGVEQADQVATLRDLGCDYAQGYHFGRPVPDLPRQARAAPPVEVREGR